MIHLLKVLKRAGTKPAIVGQRRKGCGQCVPFSTPHG